MKPKGFTKAENAMLESRLSRSEKLCWTALRRFDFKEKGCWPSYETIARVMSSDRRTAIRALQSLERKGFVVVKRDPGRVNWYRAVVPEFVPEPVTKCHPTSDILSPEEDPWEEDRESLFP